MEELQQLGPRLRSSRQQRGWTLEELAGRAGMSTSTLSRLESGKRQAGLELLLPLTRELGIRIDDLIEHRDPDPRVPQRPVRVGEMIVAPLTREESEVRAYKVTYLPGGKEPTLKVHDGHEWLYVLSGRLHLTLGEQELVLTRGEAAEFETTTPHRMRAEGQRPAEVISLFNTVGERLHLRVQEEAASTQQDPSAQISPDVRRPA